MLIEKEEGRETHRSIASHMCPHQEWNPQPRYVPWLGINPKPFWCTGQFSNQLTHLARAKIQNFLNGIYKVLLALAYLSNYTSFYFPLPFSVHYTHGATRTTLSSGYKKDITILFPVSLLHSYLFLCLDSPPDVLLAFWTPNSCFSCAPLVFRNISTI